MGFNNNQSGCNKNPRFFDYRDDHVVFLFLHPRLILSSCENAFVNKWPINQLSVTLNQRCSLCDTEVYTVQPLEKVQNYCTTTKKTCVKVQIHLAFGHNFYFPEITKPNKSMLNRQMTIAMHCCTDELWMI